MLQLLARNAIVFAGLLLLANTIIQRKYKVFSLYVLIVLAGIVIALLHPSDYLRQKMSTAVDIGGSNSRFIRLQASWETFLENPVFGAGKQVSERKRVYYYAKRNDEKAIKNELNAHNQYMEYLSTYGIFGFLLFLVVVGRFLYLAAYKFPSNLDTWLIVAFLFASITESTLERSLGIKIFSFIMALTVYHILTDTQFRIKSNLNGHRNLPSNGV